eukprot:CAMPEP_0197185976 /NCGR_PEP_ID=MMETSP1423-20130617/12956_1 /TAXON_ID=476441 /ORGANISM="Pseudo-nitzschia heimii, Strain UNC1101" /LENGTH=685 /DNA_ID=CAMNT_0042637161 /DNA_START=92 /DNA_END=2149 /DNA_ORIENTATION=-
MNLPMLALKFGWLFSTACCLFAVADSAKFRDDVIVLMYETDDSLRHDEISPLHFFEEKAKFANLQTAVFGGKLAYHGFGDKYQTLKPLLEVADKEKLIILADARDVILNVPNNDTVASLAVDNFVETYKRLTANSPNAVVLSAEAQCCVSAMAHAHPSDYFEPITKKRKNRACSSGKSDCLWYPSKNIEDWHDFMEDVALKTTGEVLSDVYLNAGLMVGYPKDLINLLDVLDIHAYEDDQAVLSGLMYQFPDMIKLDYKQEIFGNNQWPRGLVDGCVFEPQGDNLSLIHTETRTQPLIVHTPGKFYDCLDVLIEDLGGVSQQRYLLDLEHMNTVAANNGFAVTSGEEEDTHDASQQRRGLQAFTRIHMMIAKIQAALAEKEDLSTRLDTEDVIESNYGVSNYGVASNYGISSGVADIESNYGVTSNYGISSNYGVASMESNYGVASNYGIVDIEKISAGNYGVADFETNYGAASNYGVAANDGAADMEGNYGVASNYGTIDDEKSFTENYGVADFESNYGVTSNYEIAANSGVADMESNYGVVDMDNNYGIATNYGVASNDGVAHRESNVVDTESTSGVSDTESPCEDAADTETNRGTAHIESNIESNYGIVDTESNYGVANMESNYGVSSNYGVVGKKSSEISLVQTHRYYGRSKFSNDHGPYATGNNTVRRRRRQRLRRQIAP